MSSTRSSAAGFCARGRCRRPGGRAGSLPAAVFSRAIVTRAGSVEVPLGDRQDPRRHRRREERRLARRRASPRGSRRCPRRTPCRASRRLRPARARECASSVERLAAEVIERAAGRGDDDVGAALERADLLLHRRAAVERHDLDARCRARTCGWPRHLHRQLARRHEHQAVVSAPRDSASSSSSRWSIGSANAAVLPVPVAACASRSRPGEHQRDRLALNRRRLFVAEGGQRGEERRREPERREVLGRVRKRRHACILKFQPTSVSRKGRAHRAVGFEIDEPQR